MKFIDTPPDAVAEILEARTLYSKTFDLGPADVEGHRLYRWIGTVAPVHVPSDILARERGEPFTWEDPDTNIELRDGFYRVKHAWYELEVNPAESFRYRIRSRRQTGGDVLVTLEEAGSFRAPFPAKISVSGNQLHFHGVAPDLDLVVICEPWRVRILRRLLSAAAPKRFVWRVERTVGSTLAVSDAVHGSDNADGLAFERLAEALPRNRQRGVEVKCVAREREIFGGREIRFVEELWTGRTFYWPPANPVSEARLLRDEAETLYPVEIDPDVTEVIVADADDGNQTGASTWLVRKHYAYGHFGHEYTSYSEWPGWRFQTVAIAQGQQITLAQLKVDCNKVNLGGLDPGSTIHGDDVDDAPAFSNTSLPSGFTNTTATGTLLSSSTGLKTIAVTGIVQEILDRAGWVSGNDMRLAANASGGGTGSVYFDDLGCTSTPGNTGPFATLEVTFAAAGQPAMRRISRATPGIPLHVIRRM